MQKILVLGAGKSSTALISYLLKNAEQHDWWINVGDMNVAMAQKKIAGFERATAFTFDVLDVDLRAKAVEEADVVVSVLPAQFHHLVAQDCLRFGKHIITPSYVSAQERLMDADFKAKGLLFMGEMGLDPGIDHMSLMKMLGEVRTKGGELKAIRSFCGALIAPDSDNNPWHYKFTWAPMNVVLAGQGGTAQYLKDGAAKYIPYSRLFTSTEAYHITEYGDFEAYSNRDSLPYLKKYGVEDVPTFIRGTLRRAGYCEAWNALIQMGLTDNDFKVVDSESMTYKQLVMAFLPVSNADIGLNIKAQVAHFLAVAEDSEVMNRLTWLGIFSDDTIGLSNVSPAEILLHILLKKWKLSPTDKDMIAMLHLIDYELEGSLYRCSSRMVVLGKDAEQTAISDTVGLPMAMMVKLILTKKVNLTGVHIPIMPEVYEPVLKELADYGITFKEKNSVLKQGLKVS